MDKQSFYDNQKVQNVHLNSAVSDAENADKALAKGAIGYGIVSGLTVASVAGQMKLAIDTGSFIDKDGLQCAVAGAWQPTIDHDTAGNAVAVGVGQMRWVSVFLKVGRSLQNYGEDPSGGVKNDTNYTRQLAIPSPVASAINGVQQLYVVSGAAAAVDAGVRPALDASAILLCDLYVGYGQLDYGSHRIDFQRTELLRRVESGHAEIVPYNAQAQFSLLQQWRRGAIFTRMYIDIVSGGILFTTNAEFVASSILSGNASWKADDYSQDALAIGLGSGRVGSQGGPDLGTLINARLITGGSRSTPWLFTDWAVAGKLVAV